MRVLFQRRKHAYSFVLKRFAVLWASFRIHKWIKKTAEKKGIVFIYRNLMKKKHYKKCETISGVINHRPCQKAYKYTESSF